MKNPISGNELSSETVAYIKQIRTVRRNAKKAARSGNPAKRIPARRVLEQVAPLIAAAYRADAKKTVSR